jgi:hypothetical protein
MSRTSKALKRLGVAGVALATIGAGVPAFFATAAQAAGPATTITISPSTQTGPAGACLVYTVTETAADGSAATSPDTVTVQLQDTASADPTTAPSVQFCTVDVNNNQTLTGPTGTAATNLAGTRTQTFTLTGGKATFGVYDTTPETITIRAFNDADTNGAPGPNELSAANASAVFTAGGPAGTAAAADAVATVTATPETDSKTAGSTHTINVLLQDANNNPVPGVQPLGQIESGPNAAVPATIGVPGTPAKPVTCGTSNNAGVTTCTYTGDANKTGTDTVRVFVNHTGGTNAFEANVDKSDTVTRTNTGPVASARNVDLKPDTITTASGSTNAFTATVRDANGVTVAGVTVTFSLTGVGRFSPTETVAGNGTVTKVTGADGTASVLTTTASNETGTQTLKADIATTPGQTPAVTTNQCAQAAGTVNGTATTGAPAGNCTDSSTNTVTVNGASPSPSASASPTTSPGAGGRGTLSTSTPDIQPNVQGVLTASGLTSNSAYELRCYTRPSTTYFTARSATTSAAATTLEFRILPGANTRCYVRPAGNESLASNSVVINVHTTLSLSTVRTGVRTYVFQGRNLPRRAGQLITLYRVANGQEIRTSNLTTDSSGIYRVTRTFTGTGTFQFKVRTSQTLNNAAGVSNTITVNVR